MCFSFHTDVIFFIYLYQRYVYAIDPKRVNEYGTSQEMMEGLVEGEEGGGGGGEQGALLNGDKDGEEEKETDDTEQEGKSVPEKKPQEKKDD